MSDQLAELNETWLLEACMEASTTSINTSKLANFTLPLLKQPLYRVILISTFYSIVTLIGMVGNVAVVLVVMLKPRLHSITNYFLVNLAIADLLYVLLLPINLLANILSGALWLFR